MIISQPDFEFLPAILVLLWPFAVIFPEPRCQHIRVLIKETMTNFIISLSLIIRFISEIRRELTHTERLRLRSRSKDRVILTLFADQTVIAIIGIIGISHRSASTIIKGSEVKF